MVLFLSVPVHAVEYFARTDGGPVSRCTGLVNAADTGAGSSQPCALSDLQEALDVAAGAYGNFLTVRATDTFTVTGSFFNRFFLNAQSGTPGYTTVRTSAYASLPAGRVAPANASLMFKIVAIGTGGALATSNNAKYWKIIGAEITNTAPDLIGGWTGDFNFAATLIDIGPSGISGNDHIWFDRCFIHPKEFGTSNIARTSARAFAVSNTPFFTLTNSYAGGFGGTYFHVPGLTIDSEAIQSVMSTDYLIDNNYLGAQFNPFFLGGGTSTGGYTSGTVSVSPSPTSTAFTLDTVANLAVGDYVSIQQTSGDNANAKVLTINSGTKAITVTPPYRPAGSVTIAAGRGVRWNGSNIQRFTFTHNTTDTNPDGISQTFYDAWVAGGMVGVWASPKGHFEIKTCVDCLIEGNVMGGWPGSMAFTCGNQQGYDPWTVCKNITVRNNWIMQFTNAISWAGGCPVENDVSGVPTCGGNVAAVAENISFTNNLFTQTNTLAGDYGMTRWGTVGTGTGFTFQHNTFRVKDPGALNFIANNGRVDSAIWKDNIFAWNAGGFDCSLGAHVVGSDCYPSWLEGNNIWVNNSGGATSNSTIAAAYPADVVVSNEAAVVFVGSSGTLANNALQAGSPGHNAASDGSDIGVNIQTLTDSLNGLLPTVPLGVQGKLIVKGRVIIK